MCFFFFLKYWELKTPAASSEIIQQIQYLEDYTNSTKDSFQPFDKTKHKIFIRYKPNWGNLTNPLNSKVQNSIILQTLNHFPNIDLIHHIPLVSLGPSSPSGGGSVCVVLRSLLTS